MAEWTIVLNDRVIRSFTIEDGGAVTIGRGTDADVVIDNTAISRLHATLALQGGIYLLTDLQSLNGTFVNGRKVENTVPITPRDTVELGKFRLVMADMPLAQPDALSQSTPDIEDATVFVQAAKKKPPVAESPSAAGAKSVIRAVEGEAQPKEIGLDGRSSVKIGKDPGCDLRVGGWLVAQVQCYIISRDEKYFIVPQRSWRATRLNSIKITEENRLRKGDVIEIGNLRLRFE